MKKNYKIIVLLVIFCASSGYATSRYLNSNNFQKPIIENFATYDEFNLQTLSNKSESVVHAIVTKVAKPKIVKIPVATNLDINNNNKGKFLESVETEVTLKVVDSIKNKENKEFIIYNEEGGETETAIIEPHGGLLKLGDEVIIYLNKDGHSWGSQGILKVKDGLVKIDNTKEKIKEEKLNDIIPKLKLHVKN